MASAPDSLMATIGYPFVCTTKVKLCPTVATADAGEIEAGAWGDLTTAKIVPYSWEIDGTEEFVTVAVMHGGVPWGSV